MTLTVMPNPANPRAEFQLGLDRTQRVRVTVHDIAGRRLASLHDGPLDSGAHRFVWEGRDGHGRSAPSGVYLIRVQGAYATRSAKFNLIK
jgi:flagellar hook assembly protein FlgD